MAFQKRSTASLAEAFSAKITAQCRLGRKKNNCLDRHENAIAISVFCANGIRQQVQIAEVIAMLVLSYGKSVEEVGSGEEYSEFRLPDRHWFNNIVLLPAPMKFRCLDEMMYVLFRSARLWIVVEGIIVLV